MENFKFNVGDNVKIVSNDLQPAMVVTIATYIQVQGFHVGSKMINIIVAN